MADYIEIQNQQQAICARFQVNWMPIGLNALVAFNESLFSSTQPINGLRQPNQKTIDGWYLWSGGDVPANEIQFFKPVTILQILEQRPLVLKYLGLPEGWRFQVDDLGYEDIWFEASVLEAKK